MTVFYELKAKDYLAYQLYIASTNKRIKTQRTRSWLMATAAMLMISFISYDSGNDTFSYMLLLMSGIVLIFFPLYLRRHYENFYRRYIEDVYRNRFNMVSRLTITESSIESHDPYCEMVLRPGGLASIIDVPAYYYIALKSGGHLIVPKAAQEPASLREALAQIGNAADIPFVDATAWKWK